MQNHLDISLTRIWRVTVVRSGDQSEYLVPEDRLSTVIDTVTSELNVQHLWCVPRYRYQLPHTLGLAPDGEPKAAEHSRGASSRGRT